VNAKELREAAEKSRAWYVTPNLEDAHRNIPDHVFYTGYHLATYILATVRDDDDELITPLWLSQWGECLVDCRKIGILCIDLYDGNWSVIGEFGEVYIKPQEKRGQFRSLCRGLGIELKEGGQ